MQIYHPRFFVGYLLLLVALAGVVSCVHRPNPAGDGSLEILATPGAPLPQAADRTGLVEPRFLRHHETRFINRGSDYVYGDLFMVYGCLRVSYTGYEAPDDSRGFMPVWPAPFELQVHDGVMSVVNGEGMVVAREGDTVRLSGRLAPLGAGRSSDWDWVGEPGATCIGPYWIIGDEVSAGRELSRDPSQPWVYFPRIKDARGYRSFPDARLEGNLVLSGRCLRISASNLYGTYLVIWPPGFSPARDTEGVVVVNGGGSVVARVGEPVSVGGYNPKGFDYLGNPDCPGRYFYAYEITSEP